MTISKLAASAGVAVSTVRFYERAGLLPAEQRSANNYRSYGEKSVERLRLIRAAQGVGLSMKDVAELLALVGGDGSPCRDIDLLLRRRLDDIRRRVTNLRRVEKALVKAIGTCCQGEDPGLCERVDQMRGEMKNVCSA
jgi:MerR family mercuric resistance operon transcriptional regulator